MAQFKSFSTPLEGLSPEGIVFQGDLGWHFLRISLCERSFVVTSCFAAHFYYLDELERGQLSEGAHRS